MDERDTEGIARRLGRCVNFKDRAMEEATKFGTCKLGCTCKGKHLNADKKQGFEKGAEWGYQQAVEELRSKDAPTEMHRPYPYNHAWADWLLEKAGMKDE